jgi:hypothetical protein
MPGARLTPNLLGIAFGFARLRYSWNGCRAALLSAVLAALTWGTALALVRETLFPVPAGILKEQP